MFHGFPPPRLTSLCDIYMLYYNRWHRGIICSTFMTLIHFSCYIEKWRVFISRKFDGVLSAGLLRPLLVCPFLLLSVLSFSLFCLRAEQGLSLPVRALSLLSQQVISSPLCRSPPLALLSNAYISRAAQECPICLLESSIAYSAGSRKTSHSFWLWVTWLSEASERESCFPGFTQARSYWLSESCYFVLRTGMSLLLLGTPEANHSEGVWSCPVWERTLQSLCLPAAFLPHNLVPPAWDFPAFPGSPSLGLSKTSHQELTEVEGRGDWQF